MAALGVEHLAPSLAALLPSSERLPPVLPVPTLLDGLEATTGWTGTGCTVSLDTTHTLSGTGSVMTTGDGSTASQYGTKTVTWTGTPANMGVVAAMVYRADPSKITDVGLQVVSGANSTQGMFSDGSAKFRSGWRPVAFNINEGTLTSATSQVSSVTARLKSTATGAKNSAVSFDALHFNAKGIPTVVFTFDDGYDTIVNVVKPILDAYGWKATFYCPPALLGTTGKITLAQCQALYAAGWDIACDSWDDTAFTSMADTATALANIKQVRDFLIANGMPRGCRHWCWPNGTWSEALCTAFVGAGFLTGRTVEPQSTYDRFGLGDTGPTTPSKGFQPATTLASATALIDEILRRGSTQFFHFHDVPADDNPSGIGCKVSLFRDLMAYIYPYWASGELQVLTVSQRYAQAVNGFVGA